MEENVFLKKNKKLCQIYLVKWTIYGQKLESCDALNAINKIIVLKKQKFGPRYTRFLKG